MNILREEDWIVHLDEETLLTTNVVSGILNFCEEGKHDFGQGVITYANGEIINWVTTLSDSFRYIFVFLIKFFCNIIDLIELLTIWAS